VTHRIEHPSCRPKERQLSSAKEKHAQNVISTISDYFLTQRVKPNQEDYSDRLAKHHAVILAAMKARQHADAQYTDDLKASIEALAGYYPKQEH
jgi:nickel superoxide dismutase